jgi:hypothetical protein
MIITRTAAELAELTGFEGDDGIITANKSWAMWQYLQHVYDLDWFNSVWYKDNPVEWDPDLVF